MFVTDTHPRARAVHRCDLCSRSIALGETYRRSVVLDGGTAHTWKECAHCDALARWVCRLYDLDEYGPENIADWDVENLEQLRIKAWQRKSWRRADGSLYPVPTLVMREDRYGFGWPVGITIPTVDGREHNDQPGQVDT